MSDTITVRGARLHNLKNISLEIPKGRLVVLTGVSGSGKSTLGFDILHREGQRQYLEALGLVPFGMSRAPVDELRGLSPSVSVESQPGTQNPRSTVGTASDVYTYLRVLFARLGKRVCPQCGKDVPPSFQAGGDDWAAELGTDEAAPADEVPGLPCPHCGGWMPELSMAHFSFNKPQGACPTCTGLGRVNQADLTRLVDGAKSVLGGAVYGWNALQIQYHSGVLQAAAAHYGFELDLAAPVSEWSVPKRDLLCFGVESAEFQRHFPTTPPPASVRDGRFEGVATGLLRRYAEHIEDAEYTQKVAAWLVTQDCPDCAGTRLRPESRAVRLHGRTIVELAGLPLEALGEWLEELRQALSGEALQIAEPLLAELRERIRRLSQVGIGYLALERASPSLSAGEAQRLRLASLLGSGLTGVLYVFDEPTVGLHARDTQRLIDLLCALRDLGNTVLVIEHDLEVIAAADHVIDFGPGGGRHGGQVVGSGTPGEIAQMSGSLTGDYLSGRAAVPCPAQRRVRRSGQAITIYGARHHNLQGIDVRLPLGLLVAVTGVSGAGKSSLVFDILDRALRQRLYGAGEPPGAHERIDGLELVDKVITIDQAHIGRMPRSNAATYTEIFTPIREAFAATPEARQRSLAARHFSFNLPGGRCERCEGAGVLSVRMHFLPDVEVRCPACQGRRFKDEVMAVRYAGQNIAQVLEMTLEDALELFAGVPAAAARLQVLCEVGLGYLQLGQPAMTLSGGEAQRVKLAKELGRRTTGRTLILLDEPTTGLHLADTARLLGVLQRLVEAGNSLVVVEHNLEVIAAADWVIDLGPGGGAGGGRLVAQGTPEQIARVRESHTGKFLHRRLP